MCGRCEEIRRRTLSYRNLLERVSDAQMADGITRLLADLQRELIALHPDPEPPQAAS
jgi:hypothetical protein